MATSTVRRTTRPRTTPKSRTGLPVAAKRHGCTCLDLPRLHARGDDGCEHETGLKATVTTVAQIENNRIREAQAAAFLRDCGTDPKEMR